MYICSFSLEFVHLKTGLFLLKYHWVFVWVFRGKALVWTKCDLNLCHLYCLCLMLCSLRNVKYQLVVGRECFCFGLCLPVGADLARVCRKPSRRTVSTNGRIKLPFIEQMRTYYVPGTVLRTWGTSVNKTGKKTLSLCSLHSSWGWGAVLRVVAGCTRKYFVIGRHQRQADSLAERDRESAMSISGRGAFQVEEIRSTKKASRAGMCLTHWGTSKEAPGWLEPRKGRGTGLEMSLGGKKRWLASVGLHSVQEV